MKLFILFLLATLSLQCAFGQKLPNKQEASVRAPAGMKIDGKAIEWGDGFRAYNSAVKLFYSMANDDENLYFTLKAADIVVIEKALVGGIAFVIEPIKKNSGQNSVSITSPVRPIRYFAHVFSPLRDTTKNIFEYLPGMNLTLDTSFKQLEVTGALNIVDGKIPVYNEFGILSAGRFQADRSYSYEIAIPIKYFIKNVSDQGQFKYAIKLNSLKNAGYVTSINGKEYNSGSPEAIESAMKFAALGMQPAIDQLEKMSETYFSAEYTLAKKL